MLKKWFALPLWQRVLVGLTAGFLAGYLVGPIGTPVYRVLGSIFMHAIQLLIVPLVFLSLVGGVTSMKDLSKMGRIGGITFLIFTGTTMLAIMLGLLAGGLFEPGEGLSLELPLIADQAARAAPGVADILIDLVPSNIFAAFSAGNILQVIVFAILVGVSIVMAGDKASPVAKLFDAGTEVMFKLTHIVMEFAPFGVFGLIALIASQYGLSVLLPLGKLILVFYVASIVHMIVVYGAVLRLGTGLSVRTFFKGILDAQAIAFSTASSSGSLPATLSCARENLGVSRPVSSFVLPLGATINMDGTALYQGIAALFIAQGYHIDLGAGDYAMIILTSTLGSIGTAGVPGAGMLMLTMTLSVAGLPLEGIAMIAGIDRILDMMRTTVNVTGNCMVSVLIAHKENELDRTTYQAEPEV